jgi:hypothetical protein
MFMVNAPHASAHSKPSGLSKAYRYKAGILLSCSLVLGIPACSTLPPQTEQPSRMAFETDTSQTSLAQIVEPLRRQNIGLTGYHVFQIRSKHSLHVSS